MLVARLNSIIGCVYSDARVLIKEDAAIKKTIARGKNEADFPAIHGTTAESKSARVFDEIGE